MRLDDLATAHFPVPFDPSWAALSPSKIENYMDCPRQFFYKHVLGWRSSKSNNHLHFGSSWHKAMEYLMRNVNTEGYSGKVVAKAYDKFVEKYREKFPDETDEYFKEAGGKTPEGAFLALASYAREQSGEDALYKTLYTEVAMTISLSEDIWIHCRADWIGERISDGIKFDRDFKTGGRIDAKWKDQWIMHTGLGAYLHALYCMFPVEEVGGVEMDGTFFKRLKSTGYSSERWRGTFLRDPTQMQQWLWNTLTWVDRILMNYEYLSECREDDLTMDAFETNDRSCTKYFGCPFLDFCGAWPNPLKRCGEVPIGFEVEFWDTRRDETKEQMKF